MLKISNLHKTFYKDGTHFTVFENLSLSVREGEFADFVGPSGCGKSTLLTLIAGLEKQSLGEILHKEKPVTNPHFKRGFVFQNLSLFPWLTVKQNIEFGLNLKKLSAEQKSQITEKYLLLTGLKDFENYHPKNLSGGMQQRVAIARTLANDPEILLMDEPFGSLDNQTRGKMQEFLTETWEKENKTILFVTHDVAEAVFLADTVYILSPRPMTIKKIFKIPFPRPRRHELKNSHEFFKLKLEIEKELEN